MHHFLAVTLCFMYTSIIIVMYTLVGTNVDQAKQLLEESGLPIKSAGDLNEAAEKAVACLN